MKKRPASIARVWPVMLSVRQKPPLFGNIVFIGSALEQGPMPVSESGSFIMTRCMAVGLAPNPWVTASIQAT